MAKPKHLKLSTRAAVIAQRQSTRNLIKRPWVQNPTGSWGFFLAFFFFLFISKGSVSYNRSLQDLQDFFFSLKCSAVLFRVSQGLVIISITKLLSLRILHESTSRRGGKTSTHLTTEDGFDSRKKRAEELVGSLEAIEKQVQRPRFGHQVKKEFLK